jgi:penicillin G amidase
MKRKLIRTFFILLLIAVVGLAGAGMWAYRQLAASLPQLDGAIQSSGVKDPVRIERDELGVPKISGNSRLDVAYGLGFAHGQDRFFQMDLLRRNSAGELAELVGAAVVNRDKATRVHRFRDVAQRRLKIERPEVVELMEVYSAGVNAGLNSLKKKPFEYMLLGVEPSPWKAEDSVLVVFSMFLDLQGDQFQREVERGILRDAVPNQMYEFLMARGDKWDAPIHGKAFEVPTIPGPDVFDARSKQIAVAQLKPLEQLHAWEEPYSLGSNNWAVSGKHTKDGRALVADDMHLRIQVPHIWYRASMNWPNPVAPDRNHEITGVSLPGTPLIVVGSNTHVAWGYTNTEGDWLDVIVAEVDSADPNRYLTPQGLKDFEKHVELIKVRGAGDVAFEVKSTIWGPVVTNDHKGRPLVSHWVACDPEGVNVNLFDLETSETLDRALDVANSCGIPHQNFVVADYKGSIAWTVAGRIPRRFGHDGRLPTSWADGSRGWDGFLSAAEYPRVINPEAGRIWTANARVVSDEFYAIMGDSGYDRGARQQQIRDGLLSIEKAGEVDMLKVQLDDRAVFLQPWQELLMSVLNDQAISKQPQREQLRELVGKWGARAAASSVGYRAVWAFRNKVIAQMADLLGQPAQELDKNYSLARTRRIEGPIWKILQERPEHFLDPRFETWEACLLSSADAVLSEATANGKKLADFTWGKVNTTKIDHPLTAAVPSLGRWLNMPNQELDGGWSDMPRIQAPSSGASQRMAVSPGREKDGYMHIPVGQSGHPLSSFYGNSHDAWTNGTPTPFLPGAPLHTLTLQPRL